jgi:hypothetical protein
MRSSWFSAIVFAPLSIAILSLLSSANSLGARQAATADETLRLAGEYVQQYERAIQGLVVQEDYQQVVVSNRAGATSAGSRKLRSDLLVFNGGRFGWIAFRDVFAVDGRPVRDREERLSRLFAQAVTPDSLRQARSLAAEGSRFNLNAPGVVVDRTINTPMVALMFLRTAEQQRSAFRLGKTSQIDGRPCVTLDFRERAKPALIGSNAEATTEGTFWIDAEAGRVLQSELRVESLLGTRLFVKARSVGKYARVAKLDLWLPNSMDEQYELDPGRQLITGHAIYSDFRQFAVTTSEGAK